MNTLLIKINILAFVAFAVHVLYMQRPDFDTYVLEDFASSMCVCLFTS